ncbi:hypothetical protein F5887DRAFT_918332 [Amanita rubescens]|nr:hypothetical protein F5887DRAFT_923091 [Amanita rubescens]KAF8343743.1 hypothetical protein F5887DRAFT_918332 [Amanita rubescens]
MQSGGPQHQDTGVLQGHSPDVPWWTPGHWGTPGALPEYPGGCFFPTFYQIIVPKVVSKNTKAVTIDKVAALQQLGLEMREVSSAVLPQWSPGGWGTAGVLPPVVPSGHQEAEEQQGYSPVVASGHQEAGEQQGYSPSGCQWIPLGGWGTATSTQVVTSGQQLRGTPPNGPQWAPGGWGTAGVLPQVVHQEAGEQQGCTSPQVVTSGQQLRGTPPSGPQWTAAEGYSPSGHQEAGEQHGYSPQWSPVDTRRLRNRRGTPPSGHQWIPGGCVEQQGYSPGGHQWTPGGWGTAGVLPQWSPVDTGRKLGNSWGTPQWYSGYQWEAGEQQKVPKCGHQEGGNSRGTCPTGDQWTPGGWGTAEGYSPSGPSGHQEAGEQQEYFPSGHWHPKGQVFPSYVNREGGITKQSALAKLKEKREKLKQLQNGRAS